MRLQKLKFFVEIVYVMYSENCDTSHLVFTDEQVHVLTVQQLFV
jgi:hypothetical protein